MSTKRRLVGFLGRHAPSLLRFLTLRCPPDRVSWPIFFAVTHGASFRDFLRTLDDPIGTRHPFRICAIKDDLTSDFIKVFGQHDPGPERFILDHLKAGTTFVDVGANIGYYSLLAAVVGKAKVLAFEPQLEVADRFLRSIEYNRLKDIVRLERTALSDRRSEMRLTRCPGNSGHAHLVASDKDGTSQYTVPVISLDEWMIHNPCARVTVCKIDTEGAEFQVLHGMAQLLVRDSPAIVVEMTDAFLAGFNATRSGLVEFLERRGYEDVSSRYLGRQDCNRYFIRP